MCTEQLFQFYGTVKVNHDSLPSFPEHNCPGRCKPDCFVDINGGSNTAGFNRNLTASAGKENSYLIYKVICGKASCCLILM